MDTYMRATAKGFVLLVAFVALHACGGGGGDDPPPQQPPSQQPPAQQPPAATAPSALSYTSPQTLTVGTAITALSPTVTGTVTSYAASPALPAGLAIDATTGVISGTPTAAAAAADYTITASNAAGSTTFPLNITVNDAATGAPSALSYSSPQTFTVGTAITELTPTVTGTVSSYAVSPALPAGLAIDATTGVISGTPTTAAAEAPYTITASNAAGSTTFDLMLAVSAAGERSTTDRDDGANKDIQQVHVLYVVPNDSSLDRQFDTNGALEGSVRSWNKWLGDQLGGPKLRLDTYGANGNLDVTFMQLTADETAHLGTGGTVRPRLEFLMLAKGFNAPNKIYLAYYEGDGAGCGSGPWPPDQAGALSVLYLRGVGSAGPPATADCPPATFAGENDPPAAWEYRGVHEALHPLGIVPSCAANVTTGGHVNDDSQDLMYGGTMAAAPRIDRDRNDYFGGNHPPECLDLMNSAYLDPMPAGAQEPPGHPYANLTTTGECSVEGTVPNAPGTDPATITFVNNYAPGGVGTELSVVQLVPNGGSNARANVNSLPYLDGLILNGQSTTPPTVGTVYVVTTRAADPLAGECVAIVTATAAPGRFVITSN